MSTRSSIWYAEEKGKTVHIYGELGEREMKNGRGVAAPVYIAVDEGGANKEASVRLPRPIAEAILSVLQPKYLEETGHGII
jgi:hypothetical protein